MLNGPGDSLFGEEFLLWYAERKSRIGVSLDKGVGSQAYEYIFAHSS